MAIKVLQTGDGHLDDSTHGAINPLTGLNRAWESHARALASTVEHALEHKVDLFLHAGDAFKNGRPSQEAVLMFADVLTPLVKEGIPVVLLGGNHDLITVPTSQRTATSTVASLLSQHGEVHYVEREPELIRTASGIQIGCLPWLSKSSILARLGLDRIDPVSGDLAVVEYGLKALDEMYAEVNEGTPFLLTSHVTVDDVRIDSIAKGHKRGSEMDVAHLFAEPVLPRKALEDGPASFVGLSHIHARQRMGTKCFYAGSPDRLTFTDADDPKSANLVQISDENDLIAVDYLETAARPMTDIDLAASEAEEMLGALVEGTLVRAILPAGESIVPPEVRKTITEAGATLSATKVTPADRPRQSAVSLPETISPVTALGTWLEERGGEDVDPDYAMHLAGALVEEVTL